MTGTTRTSRRKTYGVASLVTAALISGGVLLTAPIASAAETSTSVAPAPVSVTSHTTSIAKKVVAKHHRHSRGTALTGAVAAQVKTAVLAKYPGATVRRLYVDTRGVYEARIVTTDGKRVSVKVSKAFAVISSHVTSSHVTSSHVASAHVAGHSKMAVTPKA